MTVKVRWQLRQKLPSWHICRLRCRLVWHLAGIINCKSNIYIYIHTHFINTIYKSVWSNIFVLTHVTINTIGLHCIVYIYIYGCHMTHIELTLWRSGGNAARVADLGQSEVTGARDNNSQVISGVMHTTYRDGHTAGIMSCACHWYIYISYFRST